MMAASLPKNDDARFAGAKKMVLLLWALMLIMTRTYIRESVRSSQGMPGVDWFIMMKVLVAGCGIVAGLYVIFQRRSTGIGNRILWAYLVIALFSAIFSPYTKFVAGYWILLAGGTFVTMAWLRLARTFEDILKMEYLFFTITLILLFKDSILGLIHIDESMKSEWGGRLGYGTMHPNTLGSAAALVFWFSLRSVQDKRKQIMIFIRICCIAIIIASRSRTVMIAFVFSGSVWLWFRYVGKDLQKKSLRNGLLFSAIGFAFLFMLLLSFDMPLVKGIFSSFNRGQQISEIKTMTRRTEIWEIVFHAITKSPEHTVFGYGYGVGRLVLLVQPGMSNIYAAPTAHNTFLEFSLGMGLGGALLYCMIMVYGSMCFFRFKYIRDPRIHSFIMRIIPIWAGMMVDSLTESAIALSLNPSILFLFFLLLVLDRKDLLYASPPSKESASEEGLANA